jgi:hypothetical protein
MTTAKRAKREVTETEVRRLYARYLEAEALKDAAYAVSRYGAETGAAFDLWDRRYAAFFKAAHHLWPITASERIQAIKEGR